MTTKKEHEAANRNAMIIAMIAGIMLVIAGLSGVATLNEIKDFIKDEIPDRKIIHYAYIFLIFIASLGGFAVMFGGYLIGKSKVRTGRFIIGLGAGAGLIGFLASLFRGIRAGNVTVYTFLGFGAFGIILSIVARMVAKKEK